MITKDFTDPGVPEYFVTDCPEVEPVPDSDCLRIYACASRAHGELVLQYTVIIPRHRLICIMAQLRAACIAHPALLGFIPEVAPN